MNIDTKALKAVVDEIEASRLRQKGETDFQREALKKAVKNHQLDAKAIRIVLQRRAMGETKRDEQDYYVHAYELALGGKKAAIEALESGATVREAAEAGGISTGAAGNLAKVVQKSSFVDAPPHDPETGEINDREDTSRADGRAREDDRSDHGGADGLRGGPEAESSDREGDEGSWHRSDTDARSAEASLAGEADAPAQISEEVGDGTSVENAREGSLTGPSGPKSFNQPPPAVADDFADKLRAVAAGLKGPGPRTRLIPASDEDDLAFPAFLDRRRRVPA